MPKVLVTGADGFIGSHLVEALLRHGYEVKAFCLYNSQGSLGWIDTFSDAIKKEVDCFLGDIRDPNCVKEAMKGCEVIYHLAALISIPYSYLAPDSYIETNIKGSFNIFQSARDLDVKKVIHTSTSETYGTAQFVPITENHPLNAQSPYAASKIAADQLALSYFRSFQTPISILRPFNTYGPRQSQRAVISTIIGQLASGKKEINLGSTYPTRDFNFVSDTCEAFIASAESSKTIGKTINSASNFEISIKETAELIAEIMNTDLKIHEDKKRLRPENSEVYRLFGDNTLLKDLTNWNPSFSGKEGFKKGLKKTIDWFLNKKHLNLYNPEKYSI